MYPTSREETCDISRMRDGSDVAVIGLIYIKVSSGKGQGYMVHFFLSKEVENIKKN